nr:neuroblast differentiation-associated protein AHNAK [Zonotrichia albicollis]
MPKVSQNPSEAPDVAAETPNPDVLWARNGHRTLQVDSDTDVEEEGPSPDAGPQKWLKMTQNVPETPDVRLKTPNPDVPWLKSGRGTLLVESDTDVEEEEADPEVEPPERLKITQNVPETPDVAGKTPNPDVAGPKIRHRVELVDSDTDVDEDPDVQPQKRLKVTQNVPGIPDVEVETSSPAVRAPKIGHWVILMDSDTDVEGEEQNPDVQPQKQLRMPQNVSETPDVAAKRLNPDVSGPKLCSQMLLVDSDTDVEDEVNPDVQPPKRLKVTQNVHRNPDVEVATPNPAVESPRIGLQTLVEDSDTDVEDDPDVQPPKRLRRTQHLPKAPAVRRGMQNPDVPVPTIRSQMLLVDSDTDVEEDPDVQPLKQLRATQNIPETPDVAAKPPNPDVSGPEIRCQAFLVDSDTDVEEEEEVSPDAETLKKLGMTQNVLESPDVVAQTPSPDVGMTQNGYRALLVDSDTDVEEDEVNPDVCHSKRWKIPQNVPQTPDVPPQPPNPAVKRSRRGHGVLLDDSDTDVDEEAKPDVGSLKRLKPAPNVPETPDVRLKNPDVGRLQETQTVAETPDAEGEEEGWDPDVATQLFLPPNPDVGEAEADPDVGSPERLKMTQKPPEIPDVEEEEESNPDMATQLFLPSPDVASPKGPKMTQNPPKIPDVEEETPDPDEGEEQESDPDVATQLFLPSPDVGSPEGPKTAPKDPKVPDVEGLPSLDPDVATQLFLPPHPGVEDSLNPDVLGPKQSKMASNDPKIPAVRVETPDPDVEGEEDLDVATQLFLPPDPDVQGEGPSERGVGSPNPPKSALNLPDIPDVDMERPNPDVGESLRGHRTLLGDADPDVGKVGPNPDVAASKRPQTAPEVPEIPDVEVDTPSPDVDGPGSPGLNPDVATQLFLPPAPDVEPLERPERAPDQPQVPDVEEAAPNPDVEGPPSPAQEEAEAPPTPQVNFGGSRVIFGVSGPFGSPLGIQGGFQVDFLGFPVNLGGPSLEGLIPPSHFVLRPRSLGAELEAERGRVHELEVELKALKGRSQHLGAELEAEKSRSHRLEAELEAEKGRSQQLEAELKTERGRSQALRVELDALRGRGQRLEAELDAEKGRSQILEMELETLRGRGLGPEGAEPSPEQVLLGRWRQKVFQLLLQVSLQRGQELRLQGQVRSLGAAVAAGSRQVSLLELRLRRGEQERQRWWPRGGSGGSGNWRGQQGTAARWPRR